MKRRGSSLFNLLSFALVGLTGLTVIGYAVVLVNPTVFFNPFPPSGQPRGVAAVTPTPTYTPLLLPTNTPTETPTITPTSPTWPGTLTPTPRATRAPYPFTCEVDYRRPEYDRWSGVAGHFEDLDGNPLPGYAVRIECPGAGQFGLLAGDDERINRIYGSDAAWEQACNPSRYQAMEIRVQPLNDHPEPDGVEWQVVSEELNVELGGYASGSLGYVTCVLNWEDWQ
jgi:hypothetical protein